MFFKSTRINLLIAVASFCATAGVFYNAFYQRKQFYPAIVYITKSTPSMTALYLQGLILMLMAWKLIRWIFFGQLREAEVEHLVDKCWFALTETCLAFTVFRDEFSSQFVVLFSVLLFLKCFHWLADDRIDFMERTPIITRLFHIRAVGLIAFLAFCDFFFIAYAYHSLVTKGVTFQLVFGFEYAVLATSVVFFGIKYALHCIDTATETSSWDQKAAILLYSELVINFVKMVLYLTFLFLMIRNHSIPLFAVRPIWMCFRALRKALHDVVMSRRAIHTMNTLFPDVTLAEIQSGDSTCIICREEMINHCKKLPCNHIFHSQCLRSWFTRQQSCPTCRLDIFRQQQQPRQAPAAAPPRAQQHQQHAPVGGAQIHAADLWNHPGMVLPPMGFPPHLFPQAAQQPQQAAGQPMFPPPPPFLPFMYPTPPPPLPDYAAMTEEELHRLEGDSRKALEARVAHLRNIQALLDAAVIQFTQYLSLMPTNGFGAGVSSSQSQATQADSSSSRDATPTDSGGNVDVSGGGGETDEVRRRRLDRFAQL